MNQKFVNCRLCILALAISFVAALLSVIAVPVGALMATLLAESGSQVVLFDRMTLTADANSKTAAAVLLATLFIAMFALAVRSWARAK